MRVRAPCFESVCRLSWVRLTSWKGRVTQKRGRCSVALSHTLPRASTSTAQCSEAPLERTDCLLFGHRMKRFQTYTLSQVRIPRDIMFPHLVVTLLTTLFVKRTHLKAPSSTQIPRRACFASAARVASASTSGLSLEVNGQKVQDPEELRRHTLTRWLYNEKARASSAGNSRRRMI